MSRFTYHRRHQIGAGSSGVVYAGLARFDFAAHTRPVAIKVMHASQITSADSVESFAREAQIGYEVAGHPNLILTRAYGRTPEGCPYLVMDLEGPTLSAIYDQISGDAPAARSGHGRRPRSQKRWRCARSAMAPAARARRGRRQATQPLLLKTR